MSSLLFMTFFSPCNFCFEGETGLNHNSNAGAAYYSKSTLGGNSPSHSTLKTWW